MRKIVAAIAVAVTLLWTIPTATMAMDHPHKYGLELQLGAGMHLLTDVNDFVPAAQVSGITPTEELMIGAQFGFGLLYRHMSNFGWQFGYNRFAMIIDSRYRISNAPIVPESWAEQTLAGSELYALPTWFWPWDGNEIFFGLGPAIYSASLDRSIAIDNGGGQPITSGSFSDATGKGLGLMGTIGCELALKEMLGLTIQIGGRIANVPELAYEDPNNPSADVPVYLNTSSGARLPVDFTGGFVKLTLRSYFVPDNNWRNPGR